MQKCMAFRQTTKKDIPAPKTSPILGKTLSFLFIRGWDGAVTINTLWGRNVSIGLFRVWKLQVWTRETLKYFYLLSTSSTSGHKRKPFLTVIAPHTLPSLFFFCSYKIQLCQVLIITQLFRVYCTKTNSCIILVIRDRPRSTRDVAESLWKSVEDTRAGWLMTCSLSLHLGLRRVVFCRPHRFVPHTAKERRRPEPSPKVQCESADKLPSLIKLSGSSAKAALVVFH